jgi:phospholipid transport system substrate-binding protein
MVENLFRVAAAVVWLLAGSSAVAQEAAPDVLIRNVTEEVLTAIRHDKALQAGDTKKIAALVDAKILPHFDFRRATQIAVGTAWRRATPEQQEQLTREFKALLIRTYSGALAGYRNQTIEVLPLRAAVGNAAGETEVTVRSRVRQPGAEPVFIDYDMDKTGGAWKVYDIRVAGISLVATYRTSFAEEIQNRGIEGLIGALAAKNRS